MTTADTNTKPVSAGAAGPAAPAEVTPSIGTLLVVLTGVFLSTLDFFIVNVAIPAMQADLRTTSATIQWVIAGFALAYGVTMITGGRLGDIFGRRRMYAVGMILFALSSLACGIAPNGTTLVTARIVQGVSAALMAPQVLAILRTAFTGKAQLRAFSAYGLTMGVAAVFGQLIGGLLINADIFGWDWRTCFLINLPVAAVALVLVPRLVPESKAPGRPKLDIPGMLLITAALVAVLLPLIQGRGQGWPAWTWISFGLAVVLFAIFTLYQRQLAARGGAPLVNPAMFRDRAFTVGLLAQLVFWMGQASFFLVFALYVQPGRGLDALGAGTIFGAIGVGYLITSLNASKLAARLGRQVLALGGATMVVGLILLEIAVNQIGIGGNIAWLLPGLVIEGAGMGMVIGPLAATVLARVSPQYVGGAAGVLATGLQVGNSLGVAIIGVIFYNAIDGTPASYADAFTSSLIYLGITGLTLTLLVQLLPRGNKK
jgi:EmrB/QacA subfamily drug resistance transporter